MTKRMDLKKRVVIALSSEWVSEKITTREAITIKNNNLTNISSNNNKTLIQTTMTKQTHNNWAWPTCN